MISFNLVGKVVGSPEQKTVPSGNSLVSMRLMVIGAGGYDQEKQRASNGFVTVDCWGTTAKFILDYVKEGHVIQVAGRVRQHTWEHEGEKRSAYRFTASDVHFVPKADMTQSSEEELATAAPSSAEGDPFGI